jgi:hypothetical protein
MTDTSSLQEDLVGLLTWHAGEDEPIARHLGDVGGRPVSEYRVHWILTDLSESGLQTITSHSAEEAVTAVLGDLAGRYLESVPLAACRRRDGYWYWRELEPGDV